jgi:hypothetical protein
MWKFFPVRYVLFCKLFICFSVLNAQTENDYVDGDLITFTENGNWCWFQDERAVVDTAGNKLVIGSAAQGGGVDVVIYDLLEKKVESKTQIGKLSTDDHNAPGLLVMPNGNYLAIFADHYDKYNSHYSIYDGSGWSEERKYDWTKIPGGTNYTIAYSNIYYLEAEDMIYNFARANNRSPNFIYSTDYGENWKFGGQLTTDPSSSYNKGYYKYWGNGVDRIDFCCTEQHPRDYTTSIYHGYIKDGKTHTSDGEVVDENIFDVKDLPVASRKLTKVFANGTKINGVSLTRCWQSDIQVYKDGTIAILLEGRANNSEYDHRNVYARYDGKEWKTTYIGRAGTKIYASEQDYTGLGALCPNDPATIYISSPHDPGNDKSEAGKREIWRGVTQDSGATWKWTPVTANSSEDNFRPIVPEWNEENTALLWFRGRYSSAQNIDADVVGVFYKNEVGVENISKIHIDNSAGAAKIGIGYCGLKQRIIPLHITLLNQSVVQLEIFAPSGKRVALLADRSMQPGTYHVVWDSRHLRSGTYLCRMSFGKSTSVSKVMLF